MIGVTCAKHQETIHKKLHYLQESDKIPKGLIKFEKLKPVGTDCIKADPDELIQLKAIKDI